VQHAFQPACGQAASCCLDRLADVVDVLGGMGKIEDAYCIRTLVVGQSLQPLRAILHRAHRCGPCQPSSMRLQQRRLLKTRGLSEA
jgi:hypothetical protein